MPKSTTAAHRKLGFEGLEIRTLMAGDVTAAVVSGVLEISGDGSNNSIQVKQSGANWKVQGLGTTVNGSNSAQSFSGVTDIHIDLGEGNDFIAASKGTLSGDFVIDDLDGGRSTIELSKMNANRLEVNTFDENDVISITNCHVDEDILIVAFASTDDGDDVITIANSSAGTLLDVGTGGGNDVVTLKSVTASDGVIVTASDSGASDIDAVTIVKSSSDDLLDVSTGDGADVVTINKFQAGAEMLVSTADSDDDGNDVVSIVSSSAEDTLEVNTGNGADVLTIAKFTAGDDIELSTGGTQSDGIDVITLTQVNGGNNIDLTTGSGTDRASLTKVVAANELNVDMEAGDFDQLFVTRSRAVDAFFDGGNNDGDTLISFRNVFGTEDETGFEFVYG